MKLSSRKIAACVAACVMSAAAFAADASGTWKWTQMARGGGGGQPREVSLTLEQKGDALTGKITTPGRGGDPMTTEIKHGAVKDDTVSFTVEREFNGNTFVIKYSGKLAGDTITGESESPGRDGETMKREWIAKRAK